jgi:superfamily II DNA or RNA helicase
MASIIRWNTRDTEQTATLARAQGTTTTQGDTQLRNSCGTAHLGITVENADELLQYDAQYKVLICKLHQYAVPNLSNHLRKQHDGSVKEKRAVVEKYAHLEILKPAQVELPPPLETPFELLGKPLNAFICDEDECEYITISRDEVRKHCNRTHKWRSTKEDREHWHQVYVQTFFTTNGLQRYFTVDYTEETPQDNDEIEARGNSNTPGQQDFETSQIIGEWDAAMEQHEKELEIVDANIAKTDRSLWSKRTEWPQHLAGSNFKHLAWASRLPDKDEKVLEETVKLIDLLIEKCVAGLSTLDQETRRWLRSAKKSEPDVRPLARLQNPESQVRYSGYWKRFICYVLRVLQSQSESYAEHNRQDRSGSDNASNSEEDSENSSSDEEDDDGDQHVEHERASTTSIDAMKDARRLFPWKGEQKALAEKLWQLIETPYSDDRAKLDALLHLSKSFIFVTVRGDIFSSGLLHFLAVLGVDEEMGRLREANDFSYMLAGVVYCTRVIGVEAILPAAERDQQGEDDDGRFLETRNRYLADGGYSPMSKMISLLAYGKMIARNHGNAGAVLWSRDGKVVQLREQKILVSRFKSMVTDTVAAAEKLLWERLMWSTSRADRFEEPLSKLEDDPTWTKRGVSFLNNRNNGLQDKRNFMLGRAMNHRTGRKLRGRAGHWQVRPARRWLRHVDEFRELLLFCVHTTGGQPARGTEITSVRFKNGFMQDRNVYIIHGQLAVITRYHKSQSQQDKPKIVPRFLPYRVAQLMVLYLAYVQPLQEYLSVISKGGGWSEYIWADHHGTWETDRLTRIIARETQWRLKVRLTTHDYRHLAIAVGRKVVGDRFAHGYMDEIGEVEEEEADTDDALEMSAGRGGEVGTNRYGVPVDIIKHLSDRSVSTFRPLSEKWHEFLGLNSFSNDKGQKHAREDRADEDFDARRIDDGGRITGRAASHITGRAASMAQLRAVVEQQQQEQTLSPSSNHISEQWWFGQNGQVTRSPQRGRGPTQARGLGMAGDKVAIHDNGVVSGQRHSSSRGSGVFQTSVARHTPTEAQIRTAMRKALRLKSEGDVSYRSETQQEAMQAILQGNQSTPLAVVLPTGGGKSLLFMTPACLEDAGVTVVIVPFRALINNLVETAKKAGIDGMEWRPGETNPATLVFVSADKIMGSGFLGYAQLLEDKGLLRRVFVDECHLTFTASDWRPRLVAVRSVRGLRAPLIMLTATLPPMLAFELEISMACQVVTRYIRAATTRERTRYVVEICKRGKLEETTVGVCRRMQKHVGHRKGVVYCRSIDQCKEMAKELGCAYYHGGSVDNEEKLAAWLETGGLIVATSALGTGVDFPGIVFILHMDLPYGMIDFAQESGRAGRGGEEVDSIVIVEQGKVERMRQSGRLQGLDDEIMGEFVTTRECRRAVMSRYLDGPGTDCGAGDMAQCDRCGEGLAALERLHEKAGKERRSVEKTLDDLADGCTACWVWAQQQNRGNDDNNDIWAHSSKDCQVRERNSSGLGLSEQECSAFRGLIRFEKSSHSCHKCGLSQKLCITGQDEKGKCQWSNVAVPLLRGVMAMQGGIAILQGVGFEGERWDWQGYARWLGLRHRRRIWDEVMSNAMAVVIGFIVRTDKEEMAAIGEEESTGSQELVEEAEGRVESEVEEERDGQAKLASFIEILQGWQDCCIFCRAAYNRMERFHRWRNCPGHPTVREDIKAQLEGLQGIKPEEDAGCQDCWLPREACLGRVIPGWGLEVAAVLLFTRGEEIGEWIEADRGFQREVQQEGEDRSVQALGRFLRKQVKWGAIESNMLCEMIFKWG